MFDASVPEFSQLAGLTAAELIDAATATARAENAACARKLATMAEMFIRRTGLAPEERLDWWADPDSAVTAELAAAHHITQGLALHQTYRGVVLRDRLPKIGALFLAGSISDLQVRAIINRTDWIVDDDLVAAVDADLADEILGWGPLSIKKTDTAIDDIVARHDPDGLRQSRREDVDRTVQFGQHGDAPGLSTIVARLFAGDTAAGERTVTSMAYSVCEADPRSIEERRMDAFSALMHGVTTLACLCGAPDCEATTNPRPLRDITVFAITDQTTADCPQIDKSVRAAAGKEPEQQAQAGEAGADAAEPEGAAPRGRRPRKARRAATKTARTARRTPPRVSECRPGYVFGAGNMPARLFDAMVDGAKMREVVHPGESTPEPRYTPSRALADYVRCRDLTCRFPGCDHPATTADIDHTVPHPVGPTHASNLKCLCRFHHLLKTFWGGPGGWRDRQLPDGTVIWTAPTGHTYTTYPGSRLRFPALCMPTATIWDADPPDVPLGDLRGLRMPRRRRSRALGRAAYIAAQRLRNRRERITQNALDSGETIAADYDVIADPIGYGNDPPPF